MKFLQLFGRVKPAVIGMVHARAMPGTPRSSVSVAYIVDEACLEAEMYRNAGIAGIFLSPFPGGLSTPDYIERPMSYLDGLIVENMHDVPYSLSVGPEVTATMTTVCASVRQTCPSMPLGVQILSCANRQALAVALAAGLDFIRAEGFVFSHVADEGIVNACAGDLLRYRRQIGADHVQIFADIKKKHSSHALTADVSLSETAKAAEFFLADGIILTGAATGIHANPEELEEAVGAVRIPVLVGSGVTLENVKDYMDANALIVGSYFKEGGHWSGRVDPGRVKAFMDKVRQLREGSV